ncbi:ATP-binding cassette domain-containing protein [Oryzobacter terrae]|uniref:ATP-binding cassette domain-containing protein n=1 Tax=Oryzobacter terrae TaxID=1620385 RepID=UPI0036732D39
MISVQSLTKQHGSITAVDDLSFDARPGAVTGFLGPNGAGKSTTMRVVMGLDRPTSGTALVDGRAYDGLTAPLREVGALLDAGAMHPGRTGRSHLRIAARSNGIPTTRVEEVIEQVGLDGASRRRIRTYSLGMRQRLGIAAALVGDPGVLLFDEPVNGLDLDGVRWIRSLFRGFADEGRTVLVSSHLMSEMQLIADRVVIIGKGRLIADSTVDEVLTGLGGQRVRVRTPDADLLAGALRPLVASLERTGPDELEVDGLPAAEIGVVAHRVGAVLHRLAEVEQSLEQAYLGLTEDSVEHHGHASDRVGAAAEGGAR